ncbi:Gpi16 subunit, GPI transamidase component-domain-containing protein [Syncephalis pseudoplumigaleata]|uniref:Gpi16 subunit, GPI transamidase component-domain-containing protein n=1 Tax=Syncephalis pseudoplumigaleata TaxID=1712513 RepID=A0A4P9YSY4_9FUNG|nr:Gpi16 subunit, GPI transamidase component-domain-containing protein [Syncephalis pseudoplumigaleata]|eukprot:RKP23016.1 Gpi16 subunit, GPI transamidase component-domain-containing protein [Syncephalis pseudoplumigaleata]
MAQIVEQYEVASLRLSLTQGTWFAERWGYPLTGEESAGSGAELWAQLRTNTQRESVDERWRGLTHALAGVFCASLNFIDATHTVAPQLAFKQQAGLELRYGLLPRESVCTENLTPWIKQLPCQSQASGVVGQLAWSIVTDGCASTSNGGGLGRTGQPTKHTSHLQIELSLDDRARRTCGRWTCTAPDGRIGVGADTARR